jgi:hypothetical protein
MSTLGNGEYLGTGFRVAFSGFTLLVLLPLTRRFFSGRLRRPPAFSGHSLSEFFVDAPSFLPRGEPTGRRDFAGHQATPFLCVLFACLAVRVSPCDQVLLQICHQFWVSPLDPLFAWAFFCSSCFSSFRVVPPREFTTNRCGFAGVSFSFL